MGRIKRWLKSLVHIDQYEQYKNEIEVRLQGVETKLQGIEGRSENLEGQNLRRAEEAMELSQAIRGIRDNIIDVICERPDNLEELNQRLSISPTIWGDKERLHISPKAAVFSSIFNVNSGEIFIGDYTFTGSNVSFLTGSHDMKLTGLLRRDCEIKEGNDIEVGDGVWIASNVTILGPCKIGDNAVIGAGAVVVPGTIILPNTVYVGVPAKQVSDISDITSQPMEINNKAVQDALKREDGTVFASGWSEKRFVFRKDMAVEGHYMLENEAVIYSLKPELELYYQKAEDFSPDRIDVNGKEYRLKENDGYLKVDTMKNTCTITNATNANIFFAVIKRN